MPKATTVFVCRECKHHRSLLQYLRQHTDACVRPVGCQNVCTEPVCGVPTASGLAWLGAMDKPKRLKALAAYLAGRGRDLPDVLDKARSKKGPKSPR